MAHLCTMVKPPLTIVESGLESVSVESNLESGPVGSVSEYEIRGAATGASTVRSALASQRCLEVAMLESEVTVSVEVFVLVFGRAISFCPHFVEIGDDLLLDDVLLSDLDLGL